VLGRNYQRTNELQAGVNGTNRFTTFDVPHTNDFRNSDRTASLSDAAFLEALLARAQATPGAVSAALSVTWPPCRRM
jgi:hypothetical protein